jgi:hypothetical protein
MRRVLSGPALTSVTTGAMRSRAADVHRIALAAVVILAAFTAIAEPGDAPPFKLIIFPPATHFVRHSELLVYCATSARIEACTEILGLRLDCRCHREESVWRLSGNAQMIPYLYLSDPRWEAHEAAHIDDLRRQVEAFFTDLRARSFDSEEECRGAADFESEVFSLRMDLFRRSSNLRLH